MALSKSAKVSKTKKRVATKATGKLHKVEDPEEIHQTTNNAENTMSDQSAQQQTSESAKSPGAEESKASSEAPKQEAPKSSSFWQDVLDVAKIAVPTAILTLAIDATVKSVFKNKN